jgi:prepilin-type N-terminal cleavage/methylation domain-containing protein
MKPITRARYKRGFTLNEIVTSIAIVGILTAIAVPSFMRVKMGVNMEMVKNTLKRIGEAMNDTLNQTGQFPDASQWQAGALVTGSLSGFDGYVPHLLDRLQNARRYNITGYTPSEDRTDFVFDTFALVPEAGDKCFRLTSLGVEEIVCTGGNPWDPSGVTMFGVYYGLDTNTLNQILSAPGLDPQTRVERIAAYLAHLNLYRDIWFNPTSSQYGQDQYTDLPCGGNCGVNDIGSVFTAVDNNYLDTFNEFLPAVHALLKSKGTTFYLKETTFETISSTQTCSYDCYSSGTPESSDPSQYAPFEIGFKDAEPKNYWMYYDMLSAKYNSIMNGEASWD